MSRTAGWISGVLRVGGRVEGTWTHDVRRGRLQVDLRPWRALSAIERRAIDVEADRIAAFLGAPPTVEVAAPA